MRRRRTPTGWFKRDPRHYRFAMPNVVWEYGLKPVEFMIFSYLCYYSSTGVPDLRTLATGVHTTATTVKKYLGSLTAKGCINKIGISVLKCEDARLFTLPNEIFLLQLPPSAFIVYTYLLLSEDRQSRPVTGCILSTATTPAGTGAERRHTLRQQVEYGRRCPGSALCASVSVPQHLTRPNGANRCATTERRKARDGRDKMTSTEILRMAENLRCKVVIPIHWDVWTNFQADCEEIKLLYDFKKERNEYKFHPFFWQVGGKYIYPADKDKVYYHHRCGFEDCFEAPQNIPFRSCL